MGRGRRSSARVANAKRTKVKPGSLVVRRHRAKRTGPGSYEHDRWEVLRAHWTAAEAGAQARPLRDWAKNEFSKSMSAQAQTSSAANGDSSHTSDQLRRKVPVELYATEKAMARLTLKTKSAIKALHLKSPISVGEAVKSSRTIAIVAGSGCMEQVSRH